jgi:hypothetical protein
MIREPLKREHQRTHFTRRLEAFSDIVFGLCLAQSAVQLGLPDRAVDLISPEAVVGTCRSLRRKPKANRGTSNAAA